MMEYIEKFLAWGGMKKDIALLIISGIALLSSIFDLLPLPFDAAWIAIVLCGVPIVLEAVIGLVTAFDIKADVLVSLALLASVCIGEIFAAGEIAFIMQLGALLEEVTVAKARGGIEKLVQLTPQMARIVAGSEVKIIPAEAVRAGAVLRVLPGETVPVDGTILAGQTAINQAVMTGESLPVDKAAGDEVFSGTVNQYGAFDMQAVRVGEDSSLQRMIRLVQSADAGKAKIVGLADRWATWIVVIALTAALLTWFFTGEIIRAVTILVVFCPCALVLATPTAIMAAIGNAAKHGFLVREGDALERLAQVARVAFDKTGTLTYGTPAVMAVKSFCPKVTEEELFAAVASSEALSEHPLGKAIAAGYKEKTGNSPMPVSEFAMEPGQGITAIWQGKAVAAGNRKLLEKYDIVLPSELEQEADAYMVQGCTIVYAGIDGVAAGFIALADTVRQEAPGVLAKIKHMGVQPLLLTGDNENAASNIAGQLGIRDFHAACLPESKLHWIDSYQNKGEQVCMIGDGVNDAPALKKAMAGIAMGGVGSDIAVDAADIVLVEDEVKELPHLLQLAKKMMRTIRKNIIFSITLNLAAIMLAITGILNPVAGALVHNAGSVFVIINSALLLKWREA